WTVDARVRRGARGDLREALLLLQAAARPRGVRGRGVARVRAPRLRAGGAGALRRGRACAGDRKLVVSLRHDVERAVGSMDFDPKAPATRPRVRRTKRTSQL